MNPTKRSKVSHQHAEQEVFFTNRLGVASYSLIDKPSRPVSLQCREDFESSNQLHKHIERYCEASINEKTNPKQWTSELKNYLKRALDPANCAVGWSNTQIIHELKAMIDVSKLAKSGTLWEKLPLPQHFHQDTLQGAAAAELLNLSKERKGGILYGRNEAWEICTRPWPHAGLGLSDLSPMQRRV
jgi:hypothetical protein